MIKLIKEINGYPDNNFTEEEYLQRVRFAKEQLEKFLQNLDNFAEKELTINDRNGYNSILAAEDEEDLLKRSALLGSINRLLEISSYYN